MAVVHFMHPTRCSTNRAATHCWTKNTSNPRGPSPSQNRIGIFWVPKSRFFHEGHEGNEVVCGCF